MHWNTVRNIFFTDLPKRRWSSYGIVSASTSFCWFSSFQRTVEGCDRPVGPLKLGNVFCCSVVHWSKQPIKRRKQVTLGYSTSSNTATQTNSKIHNGSEPVHWPYSRWPTVDHLHWKGTSVVISCNLTSSNNNTEATYISCIRRREDSLGKTIMFGEEKYQDQVTGHGVSKIY